MLETTVQEQQIARTLAGADLQSVPIQSYDKRQYFCKLNKVRIANYESSEDN